MEINLRFPPLPTLESGSFHNGPEAQTQHGSINIKASIVRTSQRKKSQDPVNPPVSTLCTTGYRQMSYVHTVQSAVPKGFM